MAVWVDLSKLSILNPAAFALPSFSGIVLPLTPSYRLNVHFPFRQQAETIFIFSVFAAFSATQRTLKNNAPTAEIIINIFDSRRIVRLC